MRLSRKRRIYVLSKSIQYHISVDILFYYYFRYFFSHGLALSSPGNLSSSSQLE